jgi:hypothetical protein
VPPPPLYPAAPAPKIGLAELQKIQLNKKNLHRRDDWWLVVPLVPPTPPESQLHKRLIFSDLQNIQLNKMTLKREAAAHTSSSTGSSRNCATD